MPVYKALDPRLTQHGPKPARPALACKDAAGRATLCNSAMADWLNAYDAFADGLIDKLDAILSLQPKGAQ